MPPRQILKGVPTRTAARNANRPLRAAVGGLVLIAALALFPAALRPAQADVYYLALLLAGLTLLPLVMRASAGTLDLFEPIILMSLLVLLAYSLRAMYIAYVPYSIGFGQLDYSDRVAGALVTTIGAYLALLCGYYIVAAPLRLKPFSERWFAGRRWAREADITKVAVLLAIGAYGTRIHVDAIVAQTVTATTTLSGFAAGGVQMAACVLALHIAAGDRRAWLKVSLWGVALPLAVWQSLALGGKSYLLYFVYIVVAARHYSGQRTRLGVALAIAVVVVLTVFPFINVFRETDPRTVAEASLLTRAGDARNRFEGMPAGEYLRFAVENAISRFNGVDALALSMKYDVSDELGDPRAYAYIPVYAFVPRAVWPDKPILNQGVRFGRLLLIGGFVAAGSVTSFGVYHIGDLFVSFGVIGLMIGMLALGLLYRLVYTFFDPAHASALGSKFVYILCLWAMVSGFEGDIPSAYANLLKFLPLWIAIQVWMSWSGHAALRPGAVAASSTGSPVRPAPLPGASVGLHRRIAGR